MATRQATRLLLTSAARSAHVSSAHCASSSAVTTPWSEPARSEAFNLIARTWQRTLRPFSAQASSQPVAGESLTITDAAVKRLRELAAEDSTRPVLRISINPGGCSGFQYNFELVQAPESDDRIFERDGVAVVADEVSFSLLKGSKLDFEEDLIRSAFQVIDNPSADSSCGCGSSFGPKM